MLETLLISQEEATEIKAKGQLLNIIRRPIIGRGRKVGGLDSYKRTRRWKKAPSFNELNRMAKQVNKAWQEYWNPIINK